jgi:hypothetical protein
LEELASPSFWGTPTVVAIEVESTGESMFDRRIGIEWMQVKSARDAGAFAFANTAVNYTGCGM